MIDYDLYRDVLNVKGSIEKFLADRRKGLGKAAIICTTICINCRMKMLNTNKKCDGCENQEKREKVMNKIIELEKFIRNEVRKDS